MSNNDFISNVLKAFLTINQKTFKPTVEGLERQFRHFLARHLLGEVLGWEGYYTIGEIVDVLLFDDEDFPRIIVETKGPKVEFTKEVKAKLKKKFEIGPIKYGVLAKPSEFVVYEKIDDFLKPMIQLNIASILGVARGEWNLTDSEKKQILLLQRLKSERFVTIDDVTFFKDNYREISLLKSEGIDLLNKGLRQIITDVTNLFFRFFQKYRKRDDFSGKFLRTTFERWLKYSMKEKEFKKDERKTIQTFCRETAYVILGRLLFSRICEDKNIIQTSLISGHRLSEFLGFYGETKERLFLRVFSDSREEISRRFYSHLHELSEFDWWWIPPGKLGFLTEVEKGIQNDLDEDLNHCLRRALRKLNRFDFSNVTKDLLGDVYQGYLPSEERKKLGEFYTPKPVIDYILNNLGFIANNEIQDKKVLDPACGSGGFLVEATRRVISRFEKIGIDISDPQHARDMIDVVVNNIYGLDIHPFACFICEINLLFQLIDLYNIVRTKAPSYKIPRLRIYCTDSLRPAEDRLPTYLIENYRHKVDVDELKKVNEIKKTLFDFVIGNPPYVRIDNIEKSTRDVYKKTYRDLLIKKWDIYIPFIFKGIQWLEKGGKLGFITSNKFFVSESGLPLREYLLKNCVIKQIIDLSGIEVFAESIPAPAVFIVQKK